MAKNRGNKRLKVSSDKTQRKSAVNGISEEHQNQGHNTQKQALGPNTER